MMEIMTIERARTITNRDKNACKTVIDRLYESDIKKDVRGTTYYLVFPSKLYVSDKFDIVGVKSIHDAMPFRSYREALHHVDYFAPTLNLKVRRRHELTTEAS